MKVELWGLALPEIKPGDNLPRLLVESAGASCGGMRQGDVLVVTTKVVSKAWGLVVPLEGVEPSPAARRLAARSGLDPRFLEVVLQNSAGITCVVPLRALQEEGLLNLSLLSECEETAREVLKKFPCEMFTLSGEGEVYSSAGVDSSNHPPGEVSLLPPNPDAAARQIREEIRKITGIDVPVILSDTEYFFPGPGTLDLARGVSGLCPVAREFGHPDRFGKPKFGGADLVAHELACAAALLMGQTNAGVPAVLVRGYSYRPGEEGMAAYRLRPAQLSRAVRLIIRHSVKVLGLGWLWRLLRLMA